MLGWDPVAGERLASQPTLSRFENAVCRNALYRMGCELARRVIERHRRLHGKARHITIDLDLTDDPTHGACGSSPNASFWSTGRMRAFSGWRGHLDEVFVTINGEHAAGSTHYGAVVVPAHVAVAGGAITIRNPDDDVKTPLVPLQSRHERGMRSHVGRASSSSVGSQHPRASRRP